MKAKKLMLNVLCLAFLAVVGCTALEPYSINAPGDLNEKIAEYEAEKQARNQGDTTYFTLGPTTLGAPDYSIGWWTDFSQSFEVRAGRLLHIEMHHKSNFAEKYHNFALVFATSEGHAKSDEYPQYAEHFVIRGDAWGWGGKWDGGLCRISIDGEEGGKIVNIFTDDPDHADFWAAYRDIMSDADVTIEVDRSLVGVTFVTIEAKGADGSIATITYNVELADASIYNFITIENSYIELKNAYTISSKVKEIEDYDPTSIVVTGYPIAIPLGNTDYWGNAVATVTFADGSSVVVDKKDLTIVEPDMTTTGTKTVMYSYNMTKQGNYGKAAMGSYTFEVTDFASIAVTKLPLTTTYYAYDQPVPFYTEGLEVTGTKGDGSTMVLDNAALVFGAVQPVAGTQEVEIEFSGVKTTCPVTVKLGTEAIGAPDFTNAWWTTFLSADKPVASGESVTIHTFVYSDNLENWHSPCTILRGAALNEYAVVRMDNFGWGAGYDGNANLAVSSDWDFGVFAANQNMSAVSITVTNNGDNTADIRYNVTYANGESHFQEYKGIVVDSADLQMSIVTEESYVIVLDKAAVNAKLIGISAVATANLVAGAKVVTLSPEAVKVMANYSDGSSVQVEKSKVEISFTGDKLVYEATPGTYENIATVKYTPAGGSELTANANLVVKASEQEGQTTQVGASDFSGGWFDNGYLTISKDWKVAAGESQTVSMTVGSDNAGNWHSPSVVLRKADGTEYLVVRQDNFGWGGSYDACEKACNWNWDVFAANINGSKVSITVANDGQGKASIRYAVTDAAGDAYFQYYDKIDVDSSDVQFAVATEGAYLIFD